jgi:hypothetical protein
MQRSYVSIFGEVRCFGMNDKDFADLRRFESNMLHTKQWSWCFEVVSQAWVGLYGKLC